MTVDLQAREIQPLRQTYEHVARYLVGDKPPSRYQEATLGAQPTANFQYRPTWDPSHELFDASRSAIVLKDWYVLRDPRQFYYATWTITRARQQDAMESNYQFVESRGLTDKMSDAGRAKVCEVLVPLRHVGWGGNMNNCFIGAYGYGTALTAPAMFHAMDHLGAAQYLTRLALALDEPTVLDGGKDAWLNAPQWQSLRHYVEDTLVLQDPIEMFVAQNLALDGLMYPLIYNRFVDGHLSAQDSTPVAMLTAFMPEWHEESARWVDAVVKAAAAESEENCQLLSGWFRTWTDRAQGALAPIAQLALAEHGTAALQDVRTNLDARAKKAALRF
jgi:phenol hydroxylase P1 protein